MLIDLAIEISDVEDIQVGNRYLEITQMFDSICQDSKTLIAQLDDGRISMGERMQNLWMSIRRGSPIAALKRSSTSIARSPAIRTSNWSEKRRS